MDDRPQTNLQLLNQLRRAGYSNDEVIQVKHAYDFIARHFAAWFRASGKTFLAHLVGTAGILCQVRARAPVIAAGLGHALYALGELPAGVPGTTGAMRERVRRALGVEAEGIIARYAELEWNPTALPALRARLPELSSTDRDVVLIRLANELDDHLDLAVLYCGNVEARRQRIITGVRLAAEIARDLNVGDLAARLDRVFDTTLATELPNALRSARAASFSFARPSMIRRRSARIRRLAARLAHTCRRLLPRSPRTLG